MNTIKTIFWDFDGVLMNSNKIRDIGFEEVLKEFPEAEVSELMKFHQKNGGLSRYVKFRYFFNDIRNEKISESELEKWTNRFSEIMLNLLIDPNLLIEETVSFVKENYKSFNMHIVSGSDGVELRKICRAIGIDQYFSTIEGSPTPKVDLVRNILLNNKYVQKECLLIGDSINDYEAANDNEIYFKGYNNSEIEEHSNIIFPLR